MRIKRLRIIKKPLFKKLLVFLGVILLTVGLYHLSSKFFAIETIKIAGELDDPLKGVEKLSRQNLLFLDIKKWEEELKRKNPVFKQIKIKKELPSGVLLEFEKREAKVVLFDPLSAKFYSLDEEGMILEEEKSSQELPLIIASLQNFKIGDRIRDKTINLALDIVAVLKEKASGSKFTLEGNAGTVKVILADETLILVNPEKDKKETLYSLQRLQEKFTIEGNWPRKIDLRFGKPVLTF